jgi:hypothetical protein
MNPAKLTDEQIVALAWAAARGEKSEWRSSVKRA